MQFLSFLSPVSVLPHIGSALPVTSGSRRCRARVCPRACSEEPIFFERIRAASPAVLAEHGLAIASMEWSGSRLCVYVSTVEDLADKPGALGATVEDCEFASAVLGNMLDDQDLVPADRYTLEVSTPGTGDTLRKEREFLAFQGFPVIVHTVQPFKDSSVFQGTLKERTEDLIRISVKGRVVSIPRNLVSKVCLASASAE